MNYNHLRYFSVLAELEHYTLAAARLEISQPSLSSAIHNLEQELGVKLFEKQGRNVRLTPQGRFFQTKVEAAMGELTSATQTLQSSREASPILLRIGFVSGALDGAVSRQISAYIAEEPRAQFQLHEDSFDQLMQLMRDEKLDMAIVDTTDRDRSLHFRKLLQRDLAVAIPCGHPLAEAETVTPRMLTDYPQISLHNSTSKSFGHWVVPTDRDETIVCQVNTVQAALDLAAAGIGIAVIPKACAVPRENIVYRPLDNWHQALYVCILYDKWLDPPVWDFVERVVRAVRASARPDRPSPAFELLQK